MNSKTLIIYASPKKDSFTFKLLKNAVGSFENTTFFDCYDKKPIPCTDCGFCKVKDDCTFKDLDSFFAHFENAENIIFAFPVYNCGLPAPLKALVDRFQRYFNARFVRNIKPPMKGQREVTIIMTMGGKENVSETILKQLKPLFTISGCKLKNCYALCGTDSLTPDDILHPEIYNFEEKL